MTTLLLLLQETDLAVSTEGIFTQDAYQSYTESNLS